MRELLNVFVKRCPKSGRVVGVRRPQKAWLIPIVGIVALVWFCIRVIPKPS